MFCTRCGISFEAEWLFCGKCGTAKPSESKSSPDEADEVVERSLNKLKERFNLRKGSDQTVRFCILSQLNNPTRMKWDKIMPAGQIQEDKLKAVCSEHLKVDPECISISCHGPNGNIDVNNFSIEDLKKDKQKGHRKFLRVYVKTGKKIDKKLFSKSTQKLVFLKKMRAFVVTFALALPVRLKFLEDTLMECTKKKTETISKRKAEENCGEDETIYIPDIDVSDKLFKEKQESSTKFCGSNIDLVSLPEVNRHAKCKKQRTSDSSINVTTDNLDDLIDIDSNQKEEEQVDVEKKDDTNDESSENKCDFLAASTYDNVEVDDINDVCVNHELEKFSQMQEKLEERRRMAISKLNEINSEKDLKTVTVIYRARNNLGVTIEVSKDANVQFVIDAVCASVDAQILPPKFFLTSTEGGKLHVKDGAEEMMYLIEEEYDMNDTITNYDDVVF